MISRFSKLTYFSFAYNDVRQSMLPVTTNWLHFSDAGISSARCPELGLDARKHSFRVWSRRLCCISPVQNPTKPERFYVGMLWLQREDPPIGRQESIVEQCRLLKASRRSCNSRVEAAGWLSPPARVVYRHAFLA